MKALRPCLVVTAFLLLICCVLYPAVVTAAAQAIFPRQADGSLIERDGKSVGSSLIGQTFDRPMEHLEYFWGRPSAASVDADTKVVVSSGSNYGPLNPALADEVKQRVEMLRATGVTGPVPVDLVTKSASGVDPHVSVPAAEIQIPRVAGARGLTEDAVRDLVRRHTEGSTFGFLGEPRVNVLELNLALDAQKKVGAVASPRAAEFAPPAASCTPSAAPSAAPAP
jgi:potassium-transporting ATPase KdpC subunit